MEMTVSSDSEWLEDIPALLGDWLASIVDAGAKALIILGPSVIDPDGRREVLATYATESLDLLHRASLALAASTDFTEWPLVSWQDLNRSEGTGLVSNGAGWRELLHADGLVSCVRVAMELPGNKAFEIFTLCSQPIRSRSEAAAVVWATMGAWPDVRRALSLSRIKLSVRERECLRCLVAGMSARGIAEAMDTSERTATYFVNSLAEKFATKGRSTLPQKAVWLGMLD